MEILDFIDKMIDKFYTQFVLRDLLSKIIPGFIILIPIYFINEKIVTDLLKTKFLFYLVLIGVAWMLGIGIQGFGIKIKQIKEFSKKHYNVREFYNDYYDFIDKVTEVKEKDYQLKVLERTDVIMEASGNNFVAIIGALIIFVMYKLLVICNLKLDIILPIVITFTILTVLIGLKRMNNESAKRIDELIDCFIKINSNSNSKSEKDLKSEPEN